jgi:predicted 3-demethylubiquinone-9 3-methyltransferase (glyoxalase superfamily)
MAFTEPHGHIPPMTARLREKIMQKITPNLWFDNQAVNAADFYASVFADARVGSTGARYHDETSGQSEGSVLTVEFEIEGMKFVGLNGGPHFKPNPSISFIISRHTRDEIDALWEKLSEGGTELMPLDSYLFSERYGWIQDRFGFSWQLMLLRKESAWRPSLMPSLLFIGKNWSRAEESISYYTSIFADSEKGMIARYERGQGPNKRGTVMYADFKIHGQWFAVMDSVGDYDFSFNEGISLIVDCRDQEEVDYYWQRFTADGGEESMCGWLKDKYGVSWQIIPQQLMEMLTSKDKEKSGRAMQAMLNMKKINIDELRKAYDAT